MGIVIAAAIITFVIVLAVRWPFSRERVLRSLGETLGGTAKAERFRSTYFPHPGCIVESLEVTRSNGQAGAPPLALAKRMTIEASYGDFLLRPGYIAKISFDDLQVHIPARQSSDSGSNGAQTESQDKKQNANAGGDPAGNADGSSGKSKEQKNSGSEIRTGEITANGATLEIERRKGSKPLDFRFHSLSLTSVESSSAISFHATFSNAIPRAEVWAAGQIGPWKRGHLGETPVRGSYSLVNADLRAFPGISGTLASGGRFDGKLEGIAAQGKLCVPNFRVTRNHQQRPLGARFDLLVDALHGDVTLRQVNASLAHTDLVAHGSIAAAAGQSGKTVSLHFNSRNGRIEDLLNLFVRRPPAPLSGKADFEAQVTIKPKEAPFLKKVVLRGSFSISDGHFSNAGTQSKVNDLSELASGHKDEGQPAPPVAASLRGDVLLQAGTAHFANLVLGVPGSSARMHGSYNLASNRIDFHGSMKTQAELSKESRGIKALLLKPLDPFFKKKHAGAELPVAMTGTYAQPHYWIGPAAKVRSGQ
ncbi:MAG TPA: AsmA-like C-terminal region-containing protein [Candidatus Acidoferrales bacterium]|nr:AsmA-like C-terminal region-containing protein [Candidatus Acidoferrales bacterium]